MPSFGYTAGRRPSPPVENYPQCQLLNLAIDGFEKTFVNANLDSNGNFVFSHTLLRRVKFLEVVDADGDEIVVDSWRSDFNQVFVGLQSFIGFVGTWSVFYR
jgi:hypothetical protein